MVCRVWWGRVPAPGSDCGGQAVAPVVWSQMAKRVVISVRYSVAVIR
jgi:hypothetical protein